MAGKMKNRSYGNVKPASQESLAAPFPIQAPQRTQGTDNSPLPKPKKHSVKKTRKR